MNALGNEFRLCGTRNNASKLIAVRAYQSSEAVSEGYGSVALAGKRATHLVIGCPPLQGGIHVPDADGRAPDGWRSGRCGGWCGEHRSGCAVRPPHGLYVAAQRPDAEGGRVLSQDSS